MRERQQNSTSYPITFLLVSSSDHVTPVTGATPAVQLSKNGGAFASPAGAVTEVGLGWYALAGNAADRATLGGLIVHAAAAGADPFDGQFTVVPWDPFDGTRLGLTALPNAGASAAGGLPTVGTGTGQVNPSGGKVPATLAPADVSGNLPVADPPSIADSQVAVTATGTPSTTQVQLGGAGLSSLDGSYVGQWLEFTGGALGVQRKPIVAYVGSTKTATLSPAYVVAPAAGDPGLII